MDRKVHAADPPRRLIALLAVYRDLLGTPSVGLDEVRRLYEQPARPAGGIEDPALIRLKHLHEQAGNRRGGEVLAASVPLGACELLDEVLVGAPEDVACFARVLAEADLCDRLHERAEQLC